MATLVNLRNLLEHEIEDLYSAEEQIIEALPAMADSATNRELKKALKEHLRITKEQKRRLDQVKKILRKDSSEEGDAGFLERMFGGGGTKCKGMEGLIKEGKKVMDEDMEPSVRDAAIIASSQKIEHYEISGYGTAKAYAKQLGLREVERILATTLKEEYTADKMLNTLALSNVNLKAERGSASKAAAKSPAKKAVPKKASATKSASRKMAAR
ncbi:MAG TPA: ferritin-like domain-containing protein [Flavisolibacter sp.]|jgi:ferritin-like metal-binding protein YciE|nr:ferritin-like domain-containing protein [Flavisolibacter sp.]